jgi:hypothetical protein
MKDYDRELRKKEIDVGVHVALGKGKGAARGNGFV